MQEADPHKQYVGFARVEYEHVRRRFYPAFDWQVHTEPSPRRILDRPVDTARLALVGTAGASVPGQSPFSLGHEGDPSFREIPADADRIRLSHVGYDVPRARKDPDVVFPLALLRDMVAEGDIGELAPRAYSFMGYIPEVDGLISTTGPEVARRLRAEAVDLVLLVPS